MKAHDLAKLLLAGPNIPVVAETRDYDACEITGIDVDDTRFWDENGPDADARPKDKLGYPLPSQCVFFLTSDR